MPYTVLRLSDFSSAALDGAVRELQSALEQESAAVGSESDWKSYRDRWMARKNGVLTQLNDLWLKAAPGPNKRDVGQRVNEVKRKVEETIESTLARLQSGGASSRLGGGGGEINLPRDLRARGGAGPA